MINKFYDKVKSFIKENKWFCIIIILIFVLFKVELPYVIEAPGGIISIDDRIIIDEENDSKGSFGMAYVSMIKGNIPFLLWGLVDDNWDIVKKENVTYEDETLADMNRREKYYLEEAIDNATIVAYEKAGLDIKILDEKLRVVYLAEEADTDVKLYDEILSVNGVEVNTIDEVRNIVNNLEDDVNIVNITVLRDNAKVDCYAKLYETTDGKKIGIMTITSYDIETTPTIKIESKQNESGPSGGLITALALYNKLIEDDITHGLNIVGTGTISRDGTVGEIGGVKYKLLGAADEDVDVFICPQANYEEAMNIKDSNNLDINIIGVNTFDEAIEKLGELK